MVRKQDQPAGGAPGESAVSLEPQIVRGKVVRQRMLIPDAGGGNVAILTLAPPRTPTPATPPAAAPKDANADRWYLMPQR
jgi:hypothetical protein